MKDIYFDLITKHLENIVNLYLNFEEKRPIMLYDVQEKRIYAYPYDEYLDSLSIKSQESLKEQRSEAIRNDEIVVFVRDSKKKKLRSYSMDIN